MAENRINEPEEEMTVTLDLDDGKSVECEVITIFEVDGQDYIALLPISGKDGDVWIYRYFENPEDPNEEPRLEYIDDDEEYDAAVDVFDELLDNEQYSELFEDDDE